MITKTKIEMQTEWRRFKTWCYTKLTSSSNNIRLYPVRASPPLDAFDIEGHIRVTLAFIFQVVREPSREESWSNMIVWNLQNNWFEYGFEHKWRMQRQCTKRVNKDVHTFVKLELQLKRMWCSGRWICTYKAVIQIFKRITLLLIRKLLIDFGVFIIK